MVRKRVMVFIEGEGGGGRSAERSRKDGSFRKQWRTFLEPLARVASELEVEFQPIASRGGASAASRFDKALPDDGDALRILLVDSEGPVAPGARPWSVLRRAKPGWAEDDQCYLMVQCLENWLLADLDSVAAHYNSAKPCFKRGKFRAWPDLESVPKDTAQQALEQATKGCGRPYRHADGNLLIGKVDREKLKTALPSARRLFEQLEARIRSYAAS